MSDFYWSLDVPGLTEAQAQMLLKHVRDLEIGIGPSTVDPRQFFLMHLDRTSIEQLCELLNGKEENPILFGLKGIMQDWLAWAEMP
jgi:hypothetical protein